MERNGIAHIGSIPRGIEAAYAESPTTEAWLVRVVAALAPWIEGGLGIAAAVVAKDADGFTTDARLEWGGQELSRLLPSSEHAMGTLCLAARPLTTAAELRSLVAGMPGEEPPFGGIVDARVVVGHAAPRTAVVIVAPTRVSVRASPDSARIARLALYLETGLRLHLRRTQPARVAGLREWTRFGAQGEAASHGSDPDPWHAAASGACSIVPWRTPNGTSTFLALENPALVRDYRSLSRREIDVVRLLALGHPPDDVARMLRLPGAVVAEALADAAAKTGLPTRTALGTFVGAALAMEAARVDEPSDGARPRTGRDRLDPCSR